MVGSWDPSLQGAPKRLAEDIHVVSPVIAYVTLRINSLRPHNNPMRSWYSLCFADKEIFADKEAKSQRGSVLSQGHILVRYAWLMFWPCSLLTGRILEPICKVALGHFLMVRPPSTLPPPPPVLISSTALRCFHVCLPHLGVSFQGRIPEFLTLNQ